MYMKKPVQQFGHLKGQPGAGAPDVPINYLPGDSASGDKPIPVKAHMRAHPVKQVTAKMAKIK